MQLTIKLLNCSKRKLMQIEIEMRGGTWGRGVSQEEKIKKLIN